MPPGARRTAPAAAGTRAATGPLKVGDQLAGRYVLLEAVATDGPAVLWRATDEVLDRTVAVKVLGTPTKAARDAAQPFLDAAVRTGSINHTGLVRVYDAAFEPRPGRGSDVAFVISEWVDGESLDVHLNRVGVLAAPDAADLLRQAADAGAAAHAGGLQHGRIHPRNVLVTPAGRVRLTDTAVAAALHGLPVPEPLQRDDIADDTQDLAAVLYALVTGRWPAAATPQPAGGLPPAPVADGHPLSPRQLRAGVPRTLDHVITRALDPAQVPTLPAIRTPAALADATDSCAAEAREARRVESTPQPPSRLRKALPWIGATSFVVTVGITGWLVGLAVGDLPRRTNGVDAIVSTTDAPSPGATATTALALTQLPIRDFDPEGDKQENPDQARNAVDGIASTTWATQTYKTASFSGIKKGVGLLLDLGKVTELHTVEVGFSAPGAHVELRVGQDAPVDATSLEAVAAGNSGAQVAKLTPTAGTKARYVLIWITSLPKEGKGYRVGISELRIT